MNPAVIGDLVGWGQLGAYICVVLISLAFTKQLVSMAMESHRQCEERLSIMTDKVINCVHECTSSNKDVHAELRLIRNSHG